MCFVAMLIFSFVMMPLLGKPAIERAARARLTWSDAAPIVFMGTMAIQMYVNPINESAGNIALWTPGFFALIVGYRFVAEIQRQHKAPSQDAADLRLGRRPTPGKSASMARARWG
jgi:hypothetical protein